MQMRHALGVAVICAAFLPATAATAPAPTPAGTPPVPAGPRISAAIAPASVTARQGHARILVGVRTSTAARVTVRVISVRSGRVVTTARTPGQHAAGRVWLLIDANNDRGFQLPDGRYRLEVVAVDAARRRSNRITRTTRLTVRTPRGVLHAYTVPAWLSIIGGLTQAPGGQIVAAVGPGSAAALAGLQRGDIIRSLNGTNVDSRGAWLVAMRALPANTPVAIEIERAGVRQTLQFTAPPDWTLAPNYTQVLAEATQTAPSIRAYQYAQIRERLDGGDTTTAKSLLAAWTSADKASPPGELLAGAIATAEGAHLTAVGAFNRAQQGDPAMAAAAFQQGLARSANQQNDRAITAFEAARTLDPTDAIAAAFHAYALLRADDFTGALGAADAAVALDPLYEDARIARGIALIGLTRTAEGVADLRRGLLLLKDPGRAQQLITTYLEPNTP